MKLAKANVEKFYPVVGITENIDMTLKVLEVKMPQYFKDAFIEYHTNVGVMSKRNINREKNNVSSEVIQQLTDCVHMRLKLGESPKSRILTKLGWIDQLMSLIDHALRFCCGPTLTAVTAHPKIDFY